MTLTKKAGDNGAGLLTWVQGLAPARAIHPLPLFSIF